MRKFTLWGFSGEGGELEGFEKKILKEKVSFFYNTINHGNAKHFPPKKIKKYVI